MRPGQRVISPSTETAAAMGKGSFLFQMVGLLLHGPRRPGLLRYIRCQMVVRRRVHAAWISGGWAASTGRGAKWCSPEVAWIQCLATSLVVGQRRRGVIEFAGASAKRKMTSLRAFATDRDRGRQIAVD